MNHIHIEIKPNAVATFSQEPTKETLEAVKKLIEAAEKKFNEPEERYFELINNYGWSNFEKNKIYPSLFKYKPDAMCNVLYHANNNKEDWQEVAKQDYLNQELLEKAKRDYCEGVVIKSFCDNNRLRIIAPYEGCAHIEYKLERNGIRASNGMNTVGCDGEYVCSNPLIYENGKWAEIIRADQSPTLELDDFKKDLNNLLEKYSCNVK